MPPFIPHKRRFSPSPPLDSPESVARKRYKQSLFDTADKPSVLTTLQDNQAFIDQLDSSSIESALSEVSSDEFEDVIEPESSKKRKIVHVESEDDSEVDWQDAIPPQESISAPEPSGDLELTLNDGGNAHFHSALGKKKGPSKIERQIRIATHCMHVQFLLFHNLVRNGWACNKEVQSILVAQLPLNVRKEVDKWKVASGISSGPSVTEPPSRQNRKGKRATQNDRNQRDWGKPAERQEKGAPNMSRGDPLIRLLKILAAYWKKRWTITAPCLRKQGYKDLTALEEEITSFKKGEHNAKDHGERVRNIQEFQDLARRCEGSRDIGAQLFTALIRGLGIEARLVTSLQPVGFGGSKGEEASAANKKVSKTVEIDHKRMFSPEERLSAEGESDKGEISKPLKKTKSRKQLSKGSKKVPIDLSEPSDDDSMKDTDNDDNDSVVDVTPATPRKRPNMNYDHDMVFPTVWTEAISPITHEVYPVDPFVLNPAVATNAEHLTLFESRGAKADKAKQVFAYIVGYSSDGTAKEVTTRYLKRHMWPGRTKGVRMPVEKVPVYNHRGKIKRHENYDWFKTVMSCYKRTDNMRTIVDDLEEAKDLKVVKPEQKEQKAGEDTLQGYKTSAEFVLERHLRREEAIRPGSEPVKIFTAGKGDKAKEEPVWLRKDVEVCRTGESWHKEGRAIKAGETAMKMVPIRAVTLTRKREVEEAERDSGEKLKQGLYSWDQTDWIIPPPIKDGVIPKNAYGNVDCFVPTMVPKGAVHIPLRSTVRICKRLGIDYAEAVTGFEFGNKRAVPVITGVMVAVENKNAVIDEWEKDEEERRIKEEGKREKAALSMWRKWLMGLRIIQRVREEYGGDADAHMKEEMNPFTNQNKTKRKSQSDAGPHGATEGRDDESMSGGFVVDDEMSGGGFFPEGHEEEEAYSKRPELMIEEEEPGKQVPSTTVRRTSHDLGDVDNLPSASQSNNPLTAESMSSERATYGAASKKSKRELKAEPVKTPPEKGGNTNGNLPPTSTSIGKAGRRSSKAVPPPPPSVKHRAAPQRQAARESEMAVRSQYFDHDNESEEEEQESIEEASDSQSASKPAPRSASNGKRSLRARKK